MARSLDSRLAALEAAERERPSEGPQAGVFGRQLATVYGGPAAPVTLREALAEPDAVYSDAEH